MAFRSVIVISVLVLLTPFSASAQNNKKEKVDTLIVGGTVLTMDGTRTVIDDGAIAIKGDSIVEAFGEIQFQAVWFGDQCLVRSIGQPNRGCCHVIFGGSGGKGLKPECLKSLRDRRARIGLRIDSNCLQPEVATGTNDAYGYFAAICDENPTNGTRHRAGP